MVFLELTKILKETNLYSSILIKKVDTFSFISEHIIHYYLFPNFPPIIDTLAIYHHILTFQNCSMKADVYATRQQSYNYNSYKARRKCKSFSTRGQNWPIGGLSKSGDAPNGPLFEYPPPSERVSCIAGINKPVASVIKFSNIYWQTSLIFCTKINNSTFVHVCRSKQTTWF